MRITIQFIRHLFAVALFCGFNTQAATITYPLSLSTGWNLAGNSLSTPIDVKTTFGAQANVTTVWKWNASTSTWAFYAPSLDANGTLASYATGKGYTVLSTINAGEGYWVNAAAPISLGSQAGTGFSLTAADLGTGWNLSATADAVTPAAFSNTVGNVTTLWAWDNATSSWYFHAPSLAANNTLANYITQKGYKDFGILTLSNGLGFWINYAGIATGGGASGTSISAATAASNALFTDTANPVNITVVTDAARAVSQVVSSVGATLSATAADGSQFTLSIPAGAVKQATTITMTPIVSASGVPLTNGMVAGVQLAPEGQFLYKDATLTIVPSVSVPVANQTFLGYSGAGNDLHLVPPASPTAAIQMRIGHFSGWFLGSGTAADRAAMLLKRAADHEARLNQEMARVLGQERQMQLLGVSDGSVAPAGVIDNYFGSYYGLVIRNLVLAAGSSCANATLAMQKYLGFERKVQLLGGLMTPYDPNGADFQRILSAYDATCNTLGNRYTGTFTAQSLISSLGTSATGNVTFLRDDAACIAAGVNTANTACYRVETVTYTTSTPQMTGCTITPASYTATHANTPLIDSHLNINLSTMTDPITGMPSGDRQYTLLGGWNSPAYSTTITCPPGGSFAGSASAWAALTTGPGINVTPGTQQITGSYSFGTAGGGSVSYTWNLNAAP